MLAVSVCLYRGFGHKGSAAHPGLAPEREDAGCDDDGRPTSVAASGLSPSTTNPIASAKIMRL